jgi:DNA-binding MarR family transcriptional regulator
MATKTASLRAPRPRRQASLPLESSIGYAVRMTHRAFVRVLQARIAPHGVTAGMWYFLRVLWIEDGLTQRELSQRIGMMEPTTVTALDNMARRGLIRRRRNPRDKRKINIYLTPRGRALRRILAPIAMEVNAVALQDFTPREIDVLRRLLGRARARLLADVGEDAS